jgi:hypothetical protein
MHVHQSGFAPLWLSAVREKAKRPDIGGTLEDADCLRLGAKSLKGDGSFEAAALMQT